MKSLLFLRLPKNKRAQELINSGGNKIIGTENKGSAREWERKRRKIIGAVKIAKEIIAAARFLLHFCVKKRHEKRNGRKNEDQKWSLEIYNGGFFYF